MTSGSTNSEGGGRVCGMPDTSNIVERVRYNNGPPTSGSFTVSKDCYVQAEFLNQFRGGFIFTLNGLWVGGWTFDLNSNTEFFAMMIPASEGDVFGWVTNTSEGTELLVIREIGFKK